MRGAGRPGIIREWLRLAALERDERWRSDLGTLALVFVQLTRHEAAWREALEGWNMERSRVVVEWEEKGAAKALLRVLRARFGPSVPVDLESAIGTLTPDQRAHWLDTAATALSLDDFRVKVGRPVP
jgi:hypothetical protein